MRALNTEDKAMSKKVGKGLQSAVSAERAKRQQLQKDLGQMPRFKSFREVILAVDGDSPEPPNNSDEAISRLLSYVADFYRQDLPPSMNTAQQWAYTWSGLWWVFSDIWLARGIAINIPISDLDAAATKHCPFKGMKEIKANQQKDAAEFKAALEELELSPADALQFNRVEAEQLAKRGREDD